MAELGVRMRPDEPLAGPRAVVKILDVHEAFGGRSVRFAVQMEDRYCPGSRHEVIERVLNCPSNQSSLASEFAAPEYLAGVNLAAADVTIPQMAENQGLPLEEAFG